MGHSLVPIRITARVIRRFQKTFFAARWSTWRKAFVSTRWSPGRRYTRALRRAVISAKRLDPAWSNLARGREGGRGGEGRGGEGRGGERRGGEGEGRGGQGRAGQGRAGQGRAGQGRAGQGRAGQGRAGQGRAGQGRAGQGRAGQGRAGEGTVHTFHKPEPLWPRSLAGHPLRGWPASI